VDTSALPPTCVSVRIELQGDDTPPALIDTWLITTSPFTVGSPLTFHKDLVTKVVTVTGQHQGGGRVALPAAAVWPLSGAEAIGLSTSLNAPSVGQTMAKCKLFEMHPTTVAKLSAANVQDGFVKAILFTSKGNIGIGSVEYLRTNVLQEGDLLNLLQAVFEQACDDLNHNAGEANMRSTKGDSSRPGWVDTPSVIVDSLLSASTPTGLAVFAVLIIHTLGTSPFNEVFADQISGELPWQVASTPNSTLYLGDINGTGGLVMYNLEEYGLTPASKAINTTYTAVP
jgi:hypothetical protein